MDPYSKRLAEDNSESHVASMSEASPKLQDVLPDDQEDDEEEGPDVNIAEQSVRQLSLDHGAACTRQVMEAMR